MADITITGLPNASALTGTERVPMDQAGTTVDAAASAIAALAPGTDLAFTAATRTLASSTGADVVLPVATTSEAGLESAADKTKLNGIASGATVNATDAQLRDRASHTGTQAAATITGLGTAAPLDVAAAGDASASQVVTGNDSRLSDARTPTAHSQAASTISDSTAAGRTLLTAADAAAQRAAMGAAASGAIGSSGLTMTAGILGRESGTGAPQIYSIGSGLAIVGGALVVTAGGAGTVTSVGLSAPTGFSVSGSPVTTSGTLTLGFAAGYSLPTTSSQSNWDTAYSERARWDGGATGLNATTGRASLGLGTAALSATADFAAASHTQAASTISDSTAAGRALLTAADAAAQRTSMGLGSAATGAASSATPQALAAAAAAGTSGDLARADHAHQFQPADVMVPLTGEATSLTVATLLTVPYWPQPTTLTAIPVWMLNTAPTGSAAQFDIRVGGTSIFSTLPTIAISGTNSTTTTAAVFATAFVSGGQQIAQGASVTFHCTQIGSTVAGAGLKVTIPTRRAAA